MTRRLAILASCLSWLARRARAACLPLPRTERAARALIGMPARHPERITRELSFGQEEWLAGVAARLWPEDEYAEIIRETRPHGGAQ
jgi:hypothetical protein